MTTREAKQAILDLVKAGEAVSSDAAVHMLADMGEINSSQHAALLSERERARIYNDRPHRGAPGVCWCGIDHDHE